MDVFKITIPGTGYPLPGGYDGYLKTCATNLKRDIEQQNNLPSTKKSIIPAGRAKRGLAGIQLPWMAITKNTIH
jgi:hypothetical protein